MQYHQQELSVQTRMTVSLLVLVAGVVVCLVLVVMAYAAPPDTAEPIDPALKRWFESVVSPEGKLCCSIADGRTTEYDVKDGHYVVPDETGAPTRVPEEAVVRNSRNPTGRGVVWFGWHTEKGRSVRYIRCFVPAAEG